MNFQRTLLGIFFTAAACSTASAHPQQGFADHGFAAGFAHPWFGFDHLLAMIAVGLLGAQMGGKAIWVLPVSFWGLMIVGGICGASGVPFYLVEAGIALSVIALGAALALGMKYPLLAVAALLAVFGLMHGHAHSTEMPAMAAPALYACGFAAATAMLHAIGIAGGLSLKKSQERLLQFSGAAISIAGIAILFGLL